MFNSNYDVIAVRSSCKGRARFGLSWVWIF
uniref:Uncharacterized protein n=1 Tax=Arundo donax TaxID=35708 RepID=A0A0A9GFB9_ARUDO